MLHVLLHVYPVAVNHRKQLQATWLQPSGWSLCIYVFIMSEDLHAREGWQSFDRSSDYSLFCSSRNTFYSSFLILLLLSLLLLFSYSKELFPFFVYIFIPLRQTWIDDLQLEQLHRWFMRGGVSSVEFKQAMIL